MDKGCRWDYYRISRPGERAELAIIERGSGMNPVVKKAEQFIEDHELLKAGQRVLVGVSGGADSVALLLVLEELSGKLGLKLTVAHVDHCVRGEQGRADGQFVVELAGNLSLPVCVESIDVPDLASRRGISLETAGRLARYEFFARLAQERQCSAVALAHQADDQVETILHRIVRGTGLAGLAGIRPRRLLSREPRIHIVRPVLACGQVELEQFLADKSVAWRVDQTNMQVEATRNWIRHELLPRMRERLNPQVDQALLRLADISEQVGDFLDGQTAELFETVAGRFDSLVCIDLAELAKAHPALQKELLRLSWEILELPQRNLGLATVEDIRSRAREHLSRGRADRLALPGGAQGVYQFGKLLLSAKGQDPISFEPVELKAPGSVHVGPLRLTVQASFLPEGSDVFSRLRAEDASLELIDRCRVQGALIIRPPLPAEAFQPLGRKSAVSMEEFLLECRIPKPLHPLTAILADEQGPLWVLGHRLAERAKLRTKTKTAIKLSCHYCQIEANF